MPRQSSSRIFEIHNKSEIPVPFQLHSIEPNGLFTLEPAHGVVPPNLSAHVTFTFSPPEPGNYYRRVYVLFHNAAPKAVDLIGSGYTEKRRPMPIAPRFVAEYPAARTCFQVDNWQALNRKLIAEAVETAKNADQIILTLGDTEQTSREGWAESHLGDRSSLDLVGEQQELFDALKATGKPIAVVLINGRPPSIVKIATEANAIIEGWYLGEQGGNALADVLFGDINPGGKLPVTFPRNVGQLPFYYNHKPTARRGYLFDEKAPLYPFGFGLSYSTFELGAPTLSSTTIAANGTVVVTVPVKNTSNRAGDETVQIYVRDKVSSVTRSVKDLKAFKRVTLAAGESKNVIFTLTPETFQMWNDKMQRVVEPGEFDIMAGPDSANLKTVTLTVTH
jgi:beta-glucosidase